jgi:hypothetical protein
MLLRPPPADQMLLPIDEDLVLRTLPLAPPQLLLMLLRGLSPPAAASAAATSFPHAPASAAAAGAPPWLVGGVVVGVLVALHASLCLTRQPLRGSMTNQARTPSKVT